MKQRVALARALAPDPRVLLMDEPFAALDALTREQLYGDIQDIWQSRRKTIIFVTHNVREAVCLGDRVILMSPQPGPHPRGISRSTCRARAISTAASSPSYAQRHHRGAERPLSDPEVAVNETRSARRRLFFVGADRWLWQLRHGRAAAGRRCCCRRRARRRVSLGRAARRHAARGDRASRCGGCWSAMSSASRSVCRSGC